MALLGGPVFSVLMRAVKVGDLKAEFYLIRNYSAWSDADLKKWLIGQGGTPKEVLDNEEFFQIHSKALRADLRIVEVIRRDFVGIEKV